MLPGLPPRDKSFRGWLFPLVIPIAAFVFVLSVVEVLAVLVGEHVVTVNGVDYTGFDGVIRIVVAAPLFFVAFLLLVTTICWLESRLRRKVK